ncbi:MAG: HAD hydrolase family protein [Promethearchaeota archaeon]
MTLKISIPNFKELELEYLVMDMNGTIAYNGSLIPELKPFLSKLKKKLDLYIVTANTFGTAEKMSEEYELKCYILPKKKPENIEKVEFVRNLGPEKVVAIGNGNNDVKMLQEVALGIAILGDEGLSCKCLFAADIIVKNPVTALNLLAEPENKKMIATLRC